MTLPPGLVNCNPGPIDEHGFYLLIGGWIAFSLIIATAGFVSAWLARRQRDGKKE